MQSCQDAAIEGFNHFPLEQQQVEGLAKLTVILLDDEYLVPFQSLPVQEVTPLNRDTYVPRYTTALLDAIGKTIDDLGNRLAGIREKDRPPQVIVTILTDGLENASSFYVEGHLRPDQAPEAYKWTFLFLGANQDAIATAAQISIAGANARHLYSGRSRFPLFTPLELAQISALRRMSMGTASMEEHLDAAAPMSEIVKEEDRKERGK